MIKTSKRGSKSKQRSTVRSDIIVSSKENEVEVVERYDIDLKREKALTILENDKSGNPFEETEEANSVHMYYPAEHVNKGSKTHSLSGSMHSKREKIKTSFPKISSKRGSSQNSNNEEDFDNSKTFKLTKEQRNLVNNSRAKPNEFGNSRRKMGSYDINATKSMDRELKKQKIEGPSKDTIMTVNEAAYS